MRELGTDCKEVADSQFPFEDGFATSYGIATGSACLSEGINLYVGSSGLGGVNSFVRAYGSPPDIHTGDGEACEPPKNPPRITDQIATSVEYEGAVVWAQINPRFWKDTTYYVEYGTGKCSEGGCPYKRPVPPGATLTSEVVEEALPTSDLALSGLDPKHELSLSLRRREFRWRPGLRPRSRRRRRRRSELRRRRRRGVHHLCSSGPAGRLRQRRLPHRPRRPPARLPRLRDGLPGGQKRGGCGRV